MEAVVNGTAEAWRQRVVAQQASGKTIRAWCRESNCHEHAFYWWRARLGLSPASPRSRRRAVKPVRFVEVVVDKPAAAEPIRLRLGGGRELVLPVAMPMTDVAALVRMIEGVA